MGDPMTMHAGMFGRIARSLGAEALGQALNVGLRLVLAPLFLSAWGAQSYGEWLTLTAIAACFGLADFGGQLYFLNRLTTAWAAGKRAEFQALVSTGLLVFLISSVLLFVCVAFGLAWLPWFTWLDLRAVEPEVARLILTIMALRFLVALPLGLLLGLYRAIGAQATSVMYANLALAIQLVSSAVALRAGAGMSILAALELVPPLMVMLIAGMDLRKRLPAEIKLPAFERADGAVFREAISPSLHFLCLQLAMAAFIQGSVIVISRTLGPLAVAVFASMRTLSNIVSRLIVMLSHSAWPEYTRLRATGHLDKLAYLLKTILLLGLLAGITYLVIIQSFGETLFHWWLNRMLPYDAMAMFLMGCSVMIANVWTSGSYLLLATNEHMDYVRLQLPVNLLALWLCHLGAARYGLSGAVTGLMLGQSVVMLGAIILLFRRKGWDESAASVLRISGGALFLALLCLNLWSGMVAIVVMTALVVRQLREGACPAPEGVLQ